MFFHIRARFIPVNIIYSTTHRVTRFANLHDRQRSVCSARLVAITQSWTGNDGPFVRITEANERLERKLRVKVISN